MSFADWKKCSKKYREAVNSYGAGSIPDEELAQAAFKAGDREGAKRTHEICMRAMDLREKFRDKPRSA